MEIFWTYSQPDLVRISKPVPSFFAFRLSPLQGVDAEIFKKNLASGRKEMENLKTNDPQMRVVEGEGGIILIFSQ